MKGTAPTINQSVLSAWRASMRTILDLDDAELKEAAPDHANLTNSIFEGVSRAIYAAAPMAKNACVRFDRQSLDVYVDFEVGSLEITCIVNSDGTLSIDQSVCTRPIIVSALDDRKEHVSWSPISARVDENLLFSWFDHALTLDPSAQAIENQILEKVLNAIGAPFTRAHLAVAGDGVGFEAVNERDGETVAFIDLDGVIHPNPEWGIA